jgi:hypothetical protein
MNMQAIREVPDAVADWFHNLPGVRRIVDQARAELDKATLDQRFTTAAEIERLRAAEFDAVKQHEHRIAPLLAREARLERELATVRDERLTLERAYRNERFLTSETIHNCVGRLEVTAPHEAIKAFTDEMQKLLEDVHLHADEVKGPCVDGTWRVQWSNRESRLVRMQAIAQVIRDARALQGEALSATDLELRFEALRQSVPAIEPRPAKYCGGGE